MATESDTYKQLDGALNELQRKLLLAREQFLSGDSGGRAGVIAALVAMLEFFDDDVGDASDDDLADGLGAALQPIRSLAIALTELDAGIRNPMFSATRLDHRAADYHEKASLHAFAARAVDVLIDGGMAQPAALRRVASQLKVKPSTVNSWRRRAREGNPAADRIADLYREYRKLPAPPTSVSSETHADGLIAAAVRTHGQRGRE
jgi:transposase-like protein